MSDQPAFWKTKSLHEMTNVEWESLCDGCGRCCLHKLRDENTEALAFTSVACRLLDLDACRCSRYPVRQIHVPDCVSLTPESLAGIDWLPPSCAYRLLHEGKALKWWHPLVSGDADTVHAAGVSVRGRAVSERAAGPLEEYIVGWPGRMPRVRRQAKSTAASRTEGRTMMTHALFGGVNAAVLTAMANDLAPDVDRTAAHCRWLLANGCNGLGVLGTTGEANSLGVGERLAIMEGLVERGIPAARLLPGTGTPAITDSVLLSRRARELGCRGVLMLPPFFYKSPSDDGLFAYFSEVIQRIGGGLAIYLYHFPQQSAVPFTLDLIARLLKAYPGVIKGAKDSSGDFANMRAMAEQFGSEGFEVYAGDDSLLQQMLKAGGAGCITAAANVNSAIGAEVYANWDNARGTAAQETLSATRRAITSAPLIPGLKALVARHTGDAGWLNIRPPHLRLSAEAAARLFAIFDACGVRLAAAA